MPRTLIAVDGKAALQDPVRRIRRFLVWWSDEIISMVPVTLLKFWQGPVRKVIIRVDNSSTLAIERDGVILGEFPNSPLTALPTSLASELTNAEAIVVELPDRAVLRRSFELPLAAESELAAAVLFEIDRQTPFLAEHVEHHFRVIGRNLSKKTLKVELAVVPRPTVVHIGAIAAAWQIDISAIHAAGDEGTPLFNFGSRRRIKLRKWRAEPWKPLIASAALLLCLGLPAVAWRTHSVADELANEIQKMRALADQAEGLRSQLEKRSKTQAFLPQKLQSPRAIVVLDQLTQALPDSAWTFDVELDPTQIRIEGFSSSVPLLLQKIQENGSFGSPKLNSSVARTEGSGQDRFDITIALRIGGR